MFPPLLILGGIIALVGILSKKKKPEETVTDSDEKISKGERFPKSENPPLAQNIDEQIVESLRKIKEEFGIEVATNVEKMYREETAHFSSGQFKRSFSPGMERHKENYPFGWTSMKEFWDQYPQLKPIGFYTTPENKTGITKQFVRFPSVYAAMKSLALYLKKYRPGRWYSLHVPDQIGYEQRLAKIKAKIVSSLT